MLSNPPAANETSDDSHPPPTPFAWARLLVPDAEYQRHAPDVAHRMLTYYLPPLYGYVGFSRLKNLDDL